MALCETPFWRPEPFSPKELRLWRAVEAAHAASCNRPNYSVSSLKLAGAGSGRLTNAYIAALASLGGQHGPIEETYQFLSSPDPVDVAIRRLASGQKIIGWGNSFVTNKPDPQWTEVDSILREDFNEHYAKLSAVSGLLVDKGLFPNPSAYTALTAIIVGLPRWASPYIFVASRIDAWTKVVGQP